MKIKNNFMIYLLKKQISFFWIFIDNTAYKFEIIAKLYNKLVSKVYKNEYQELKISSDEKVLHIGCGAYPLTEITLARSTDAKIVGIDRNKRAIKLANDIINKKDLQKKIKIEHGNGMTYSVKEFNLIIVSSCTIPILNVVDYIFKNANNDCKIIVRELDAAVKPLINLIDLQDNIKLIKKIETHPFPFYRPFGWRSFYLLKKQ
jgi:2-polyprenyl-3-methyl-5-hydroxy-6-metoxy-1,4-benzoquinol methylase